MKNNILLMVGGFVLTVVVMLGFGLIHIPHTTLVNGYFYSKVPGVKIYCLNQIIRQADTVWELDRISNYTRWIDPSNGNRIYPRQQRVIALKMLKLAIKDPNPEWFESSSIPFEERNGMVIALHWSWEILFDQNPKNHAKVLKMVEKYYQKYEYTKNEEEKYLYAEIASAKPGEL
ncbi:MAG: hypothetical protein PHZ07_03575 [Patescibacteria group bacterium]|nr:hypothetical protein [Patescibacteria group bacterium]MDD4304444.1 hypothetical protein [Patescibacteria group bacterium]MDD4695467.1 hypothetical protein [Patescibacteria group bacterium]